ncbi:kinase-like domain-containing protein [Mycena polygramma]|nr:kinase-like domain-containing protein [Mycena polygramma]
MDFTFGNKYRLEEEIAVGGCGQVFLGVHNVAGKEVAIKLEPAIAKHSPLKQESKIYKTLMGGTGVPWVMWSGRQGDYNVMVIDLLGPSLEDLFKMCNRHFSLKTVLLLADQLISRIEFIHTHGLVHRDVKPANFVMGTGKAASMVNVIDFGLAKKFRDSRTLLHIPYKQDDFHGVGTSLFAAISTHLGVESSRRDDPRVARVHAHLFPARHPAVAETARSRRPALNIRHRLLRRTTPFPQRGILSATPRSLQSPCSRAASRQSSTCSSGTRAASSSTTSPTTPGLRALFRGLAERLDIAYDGEFDWSVAPPKGGHPPGSAAGAKSRFCEACNKRELARR